MNDNQDGADNWYERVPLMFQAQVEGRCQLQRVENKRSQASDWAEEWTKIYPKPLAKTTSSKPKQPILKKADRLPSTTSLATQRHAKPNKQPPSRGVKVSKEYTVSWRLVTDSGQDDSIIRPVFGAKGYPYYPGSSMKGAFRRACKNHEEKELYCGKQLSETELENLPKGTVATQPGILRFHGGYPVDTSWTERLVDIVHPQQEKQVIRDSQTSAKAQIALYRVKMRFSISSPNLDKDDPIWPRIWEIWETALGEGIGSRVSAGYGRFNGISSSQQTLLEVQLTGRGIASTLVGKDKTAELRPNMFKATLRGHTLRFLGGMTDEATAKQLTKQLWGGIGGNDSGTEKDSLAVLGLLGVEFDYQHKDEELFKENHKYNPPGKNQTSMSLYNLNKGSLKIYSVQGNGTTEQQQELKNIVEAIVKFSMLLGGFGKSWRRINHRIFWNDYFKNNDKPMIGCHWEFCQPSQSLYIPVNTLEDVTKFIDEVRSILFEWSSQKTNFGECCLAYNWREAWYKDSSQVRGVQVWGRIAASKNDSKAVKWFHKPYNGSDTIKRKFAGQMGQTGRMWHRMYPHWTKNSQGKLQPTNQYVELLTIFPDSTPDCDKFIKFLREESQEEGGFQLVW